jgi:hypothetical protein
MRRSVTARSPAHLRSLRYLRLKTLLTAAAADGQSAPGASSDTGGEARKIEPQKTQMGLCRAGVPSEPSAAPWPGAAWYLLIPGLRRIWGIFFAMI